MTGRRAASSVDAPRNPLRQAVARVVQNDNCSGCGACTTLSPTISMITDPLGFRRPDLAEVAGSRAQAREFGALCPGDSVRAPRPPGAAAHPTMGPFVSAWSAWAADPAVRYAGSSGGVLTALSAWLLDTGQVSSVIGATMDRSTPTRTVALELRTRADVLSAAGSRYAPVSNAALGPSDAPTAFVGKPCEVDAMRRLHAARSSTIQPLLLSFFCAGTPSQLATDSLVADMSGHLGKVASVRYRGNGWPGHFVVSDSSGHSESRSYEQSWGAHLGPQVQGRCKVCPDGTGGHADIAVGDYWESDESGFPRFADAAGVSVAIARTERGHEALLAAQQAGVVVLGPIELDSVAAIQPLQVKRISTLAGRLIGLRLGGRPVPRIRGYALLRFVVRRPRTNVAAARGAFRRARQARGSIPAASR